MILAIDTSTQWLSVALYDAAQQVFLFEKTWRATRRHTIELAPAITNLLQEVGTTIQDVDTLAVATGPGSFTSLRIGLAFSKGIVLANRINLIGVPSLDVLAFSQPAADISLICVLQAGRDKLAACRYGYQDRWVAQGDPFILSPQELSEEINEETIICGEMDAEERRVISRKWKKVHLCSTASCVRRAAFLAELAAQRCAQGKFDNPMSLAPIYLHTANPTLAEQ
jgi:tRNA threonylcarbamoyladenosine biosynthesis protein TsaB